LIIFFLIKLFLLGKEKVWMDYFYFDASALAKRYAPETGTDAVNQIFENTALERLMCLTIGATEVVWILVRKRNDGRVSQNFFLQALLNLRDEVIDNPDFTTITVDNLTVIDSIGFIIQHSINSTDAIVLASALQINFELLQRGDKLIFVSSDKRLNRAAQLEGLEVLNPETEND
jgi:predicted nucleic acid-binding protein